MTDPLVPDGAIVNAELRVVQYVDGDDAGMKWGMSHKGDMPLSSFLGLLVLAGADLYRQAQEEWCGDEPEHRASTSRGQGAAWARGRDA